MSLPGKMVPNGKDVARAKQYVPTANAVVGPVLGALVQVIPLLTNTFPAVPGATNVTESNPGPVPGATITALGTVVLVPVPPLVIGIGLPE